MRHEGCATHHEERPDEQDMDHRNDGRRSRRIGRRGVGVNPLRGQNNVQGACDMGSFPHELAGYRHISDAATRALFERE